MQGFLNLSKKWILNIAVKITCRKKLSLMNMPKHKHVCGGIWTCLKGLKCSNSTAHKIICLSDVSGYNSYNSQLSSSFIRSSFWDKSIVRVEFQICVFEADAHRKGNFQENSWFTFRKKDFISQKKMFSDQTKRVLNYKILLLSTL